MTFLKRFKHFSAFNLLLWSASAAIILGGIAALIIAFGPVDVLKNWTTTVGGEGKSFVAGQTVYFESKSEKLISIPGTSDRKLLCDAKGQYIEREITIGTVALNNPAGDLPLRKKALQLPLVQAFDDEQGNSTLPRVCRIHFNACYKPYGFRNHCEQAETERFIVTAEGKPTDNSGAVSVENESTNSDPTTTRSTTRSTTTTPQTATNQGSTTNSTTESTTTNNNTTVTPPATSCVVDTNLLGLVPIKLIC